MRGLILFALLGALSMSLPGPAAAQGGPGVMRDPSSHPEGDGMGPRSNTLSGLPFRPATPEEIADRCGASGLQHLVGRRWPQPLPAHLQRVRVYGPGDPVTMDHSPERLNVELNAARRRIRAIRCG